MRPISMLAIAATGLFCSGAVGATAPAFHLVFDGSHTRALLHEGTFTTLSAWCSSGTASDVSVDATTDTATRRFNCAGGGDFTAKVRPLPAEHGGNGSWQIVSGSGPLADLRGKGTFSSLRLGGSSDDPAAITFRSTWDGVAGFDATPPNVGISRATPKKLRRSTSTYTIRVVVAVTDNGGGPISYVLQAVDARKPTYVLAYKAGRAPAGTITTTFRVKASRKTRVVQLEVDATDAVGNTAHAAKSVALK
jgi:hypothetical protein